MLSELGEEMTMIKPAEMDMVYQFGVEECHELLTGVCSLERAESDPAHHVGTAACNHCPDILAQLTGQRRGGQQLAMSLARRYPITLVEHTCGHYSINDGRHRICIATKKLMEVLAVVLTDDLPCEICYRGPTGQ
jgi:hypothetical protein